MSLLTSNVQDTCHRQPHRSDHRRPRGARLPLPLLRHRHQVQEKEADGRGGPLRTRGLRLLNLRVFNKKCHCFA